MAASAASYSRLEAEPDASLRRRFGWVVKSAADAWGYSMGLLLWCVLVVVCWPAALVVAVLYPLLWLVLLPFRLAGLAVHGVFDLLEALLFLPGRVLRRI